MITILIVSLLGVGTTTARAQTTSTTLPDTLAELHYSPAEGKPGSDITITGTCRYENHPTDRAIFALVQDPPATTHVQVFKTLHPRADSSVYGTLRVPASAPNGPYLVLGYCAESDFTIGAATIGQFRVVGALPTTTTTTTTTATTTTTPTAPSSQTIASATPTVDGVAQLPVTS